MVFLEFGKLRGAEHGVVAHEKRRRDLGVTVLAGVQVEHELGESALEPRESPLKHDEARARELRSRLEIHQAERLADLEMLLRLEGEIRWRAPFALFDIGVGIGPDRHVGCGIVRDRGEQSPQLVVEPLFVGLARLNGALQRANLVHQTFGRRLVLLGLGLADLLGGDVARGLSLLQFLNCRAALLVQAQNPISTSRGHSPRSRDQSTL